MKLLTLILISQGFKQIVYKNQDNLVAYQKNIVATKEHNFSIVGNCILEYIPSENKIQIINEDGEYLTEDLTGVELSSF